MKNQYAIIIEWTKKWKLIIDFIWTDIMYPRQEVLQDEERKNIIDVFAKKHKDYDDVFSIDIVPIKLENWFIEYKKKNV